MLFFFRRRAARMPRYRSPVMPHRWSVRCSAEYARCHCRGRWRGAPLMFFRQPACRHVAHIPPARRRRHDAASLRPRQQPAARSAETCHARAASKARFSFRHQRDAPTINVAHASTPAPYRDEVCLPGDTERPRHCHAQRHRCPIASSAHTAVTRSSPARLPDIAAPFFLRLSPPRPLFTAGSRHERLQAVAISREPPPSEYHMVKPTPFAGAHRSSREAVDGHKPRRWPMLHA